MQVSEELHGELRDYSLRRSAVFLPKTEFGLAGRSLTAYLQQKEERSYALIPEVSAICTRFLEHEPDTVEVVPKVGTFHSVFRAHFENSSFIVRVNMMSHVQHAFEYICDDMASSVLADSEVPTLKVHIMDLSRQYVPFDYQILEMGSGNRLSEYEDQATQYLPILLLYQLGMYTARIHAVPAEGYGLVDLTKLMETPQKYPIGLRNRWSEHVCQSLGEELDLCLQIGSVTKQQYAEIQQYLAHACVFMDETQSVFLHGDLANHNVLAANNAVCAILDWEDCLCGDPVFDIAYWGTFCRDYMLSPFLAGYTSSSSLPLDFDLRYWTYYLRISIAKTVHRYRYGLKDRLGRPSASGRIQKAVEHLRQLGWS